MSTQSDVIDASTEQAASEVEYLNRGWQMVRELESFLRNELSNPRKGRCISFLTDSTTGATGSEAMVKPIKE